MQARSDGNEIALRRISFAFDLFLRFGNIRAQQKGKDMDYRKVAEDILKNVGGAENVKEVTHCFTRLRFVLKDSSKADKAVVEHLEGVISVVEAGGQFQVVCGAKVEKIYDALTELIGTSMNAGSAAEGEKKQGLGTTILQKITQIFTPLVPAIAAAGLIKGLLAVFARMPGFDTANSTYIILNTCSNIIFYYMPVFLAYTGSKALKTNRVISMILGGFLCHPTIDAMMQDVATKSTIFGLPVIKMAFTIGESSKIFAYTESVIPILLALVVLHYLEKFLKKYIPDYCGESSMPSDQFYTLQILRHIKIPAEVLPSFFGITRLSGDQIIIFGMIKHQIPDPQFFRRLTGFFYRSMMFLIRFENICLSIQTERLMEKPFASLCIFLFTFLVRFISAAGQLLSISKIHTEPKLLRLGGLDIKKGNFSSKDFLSFSICYRYEMQSFIQILYFLFGKKHL